MGEGSHPLLFRSQLANKQYRSCYKNTDSISSIVPGDENGKVVYTLAIEITYLYNSGFAIKTKDHFLVFDYYIDKPANGKCGLEGGVIGSGELRQDNIMVFVSHAHPDHYNKVIFDWKSKNKDIQYILSDDIRKKEGALMVAPGKEYEVEGIKIKTLRSTDEGVAFLLNIDGVVIYHAGDLNWWHWEEEDPQWNMDIARDYKNEIEKMRGETIDIAFVPVDPRLEDSCLLGLDYFMRNVGANLAVPMHYWDEGKKIEAAIANAEETKPYRDKVSKPLERGQMITY